MDAKRVFNQVSIKTRVNHFYVGWWTRDFGEKSNLSENVEIELLYVCVCE